MKMKPRNIFVLALLGAAAAPNTLVESASCPSPTESMPRFSTQNAATPTGAKLLTHETSTERVTLSYPSLEDGWDKQTNCPHTTSPSTLKSWSDASIWGADGVPAKFNWVRIPENTRVLICAGDLPDRLGKISVPASSELVFGDNNIDMSIQGMDVEGKLLIGSPTCRMRSKITITLYGKKTDKHANEVWHKGILVRGAGAQLEIHGARYFPTWTRLARTAPIGSKTMYVQDHVNWEAGQKVLITTTHLKDAADFQQNEVVTVQTVKRTQDNKGSEITFLEPLIHRHHGGREYQAEVGLLSRRILIQGGANDSDPPPVDPSKCTPHPATYAFSSHPCPESFLGGYGGHVRIQGSGTSANVRGVELFRMGKTNVLGHYPMHFHLMREEGGKKSSFTDSSVHKSFYRCISIHGTDYATVAQNVAFDVIGHCYYLEDGVEMYNKIYHNLAAHIHFLGHAPTGGQFLPKVVESPDMILPADNTASGFYITNSYNEIVGNAASGGFAGFAMVQLPKPLKLHSDITDFKPEQMPFIKFDGNSAHSCGWWWIQGGCMYVGGFLEEKEQKDGKMLLEYSPGRKIGGRDTRCGPDDPERCSMIFKNTKVFLTSSWGFNNWGRRSDIIGYEAHDFNRIAGVLGNHYLQNVLAACRSKQNPIVLSDHFKTDVERRFEIRSSDAFEWYDTNQAHILKDFVVRDCANIEANRYVWSFLTHSSDFVPEFMQSTANIRYQGMSDKDLTKMMVRETDKDTISVRMANWLDADGTASRRGKPTLIGGNTTSAGKWWHLDESCEPFSSKLMACDLTSPYRRKNERTIGTVRMTLIENQREITKKSNICGHTGKPEYSCPDLGYVTHFGTPTNKLTKDGMRISYQEKITGPAGGFGWYFWWKEGAPKRLDISGIGFQGAAADGQMFAFSYPSGTTFKVTYDAVFCRQRDQPRCLQELKLAKSLKEVQDGNGDLYFWNSGTKHLYIKVVSQPINELNFDPAERKANFESFKRGGLEVFKFHAGNTLSIQASCGPGGFGKFGYCKNVPARVPNVNDCKAGEVQYGIDDCVDPKVLQKKAANMDDGTLAGIVTGSVVGAGVLLVAFAAISRKRQATESTRISGSVPKGKLVSLEIYEGKGIYGKSSCPGSLVP